MKTTAEISNNVTVLVVEDDDGFRSCIVDQLRIEGFNVLDTDSSSRRANGLKPTRQFWFFWIGIFAKRRIPLGMPLLVPKFFGRAVNPIHYCQ